MTKKASSSSSETHTPKHPASYLEKFAKVPALSAFCDALKRGTAVTQLHGLCASAARVYLAAATRGHKLPSHIYLCILPDEEEAGYAYQDLIALLEEPQATDGNQKRILVAYLPSSYRRAAKFGQRDTAAEILRTDALAKVSEWKKHDSDSPFFLVTHAAVLAERIATASSTDEQTIQLNVGDTADLPQLAARLAEMGFRRTDYVYEPGDFAVRGSLLDIYSFAEELPLRIDFFGDEIDSIRSFYIDTQLSHTRHQTARLIPATNYNATGVPLTEILPADTVVIVRHFEDVLYMVQNVYEEGFSRQAAMAKGEEEAPLGDFKSLFCTREDIEKGLQNYQRVEIKPATLEEQSEEQEFSVARIAFHTHPQPVFHKNYDLVRQSFTTFLENNYDIYLLADSEKQQERLRLILENENDGSLSSSDSLRQAKSSTRLKSVRYKSPTLHEGFSDDDTATCLFTDHQIFDRYHKYVLRDNVARQGKMALTLKEIKSFNSGDYVVHIDHGVGQFGGLVRIPSHDGSMHEAIKIIYKDGDAVYVSIHALHKVSKYRSASGTAPVLSRLGTGAWEKLKDKTKKKLKDIARDLIRLYSERRQSKGFAFSADNYMQHALEASFTYEDTPDQLRVTREVKQDMESVRPMDRLVCGDVGFGKTEIAVRAAFKAACDNKQTAVLVPTTVLALQHYRTFSERLRDMPVRVDYLTRARSAKQTKLLLQDLADGKIDILIGTHRLIGKNVKFHDLGLLVIDEEQKFGVAVKEKLRTLKVNIDTLTMSATPIPRTLQFSLMGARDFSTLQTPPPNRRPIQTEIHAFSHEVIADAINFEMSRGGQTFIVTNRIGALPHLQQLVERYVKGVRVAVGHGQMRPEELERIVVDFIEGEYDVLISTTIVENGIDIPNANTIIIDAAQTFGLSDLHQMRGRVGRSNRKAFCYLLAPPLSLLPNDARRRLEAIETFNDLGSGINIAMQDLEIRGAGNMLGAEQSGFMAELGYETYQKVLSQAVSELRNEEFIELPNETAPTKQDSKEVLDGYDFVDDTNIDCDAMAYFPETYVPGANERMTLYRELSMLGSDEAQTAFYDRLKDRFGEPPMEAVELLSCATLRRRGKKIGAERIVLKDGRIIVYFVQNPTNAFYHSALFDRIISYAIHHSQRVRLDEQRGHRRLVVNNVRTAHVALQIVDEWLSENSNRECKKI